MMTSAIRATIVAAALTIAPSVAFADCTLGTAPQIPDGKTTTEADMTAAQDAVKAFMTETQEFLACLEAGARGRMSPDEVKRYNEATVNMEKLAKEFNSQLRAFKSRG